MTHKFIVNDDSNVNEYGYRVMTDGIDTDQYERNPIVLFMHNRAYSDPENVIGRCISLNKEGSQLIAEIEFDEKSELGKKVAGKVERGFIKMASLFADVKETSIEAKDILPGQSFETVTKSKLIELSIVDVGGNDNALKLSKDGAPIQLKKVFTENDNEDDMSIKTIALAMGLEGNADDSKVIAAYNEIKLSAEQRGQKIADLEQELKGLKDGEINSLLDTAVKLGLIPEELKAAQKIAFENDFEGTKVSLSKLIDEAKGNEDLNGKQKTISEIVLNKNSGSKKEVKLTFDYLQKHDPAQLKEIKENKPDEYVRLAREYGNGVRHQE